MFAKFFLLSVLFFAFLKLSAQNDGLHLNMRFYPIQMLSIGSGEDVYKNHQQEEGMLEKYVTVSSTTGFEVNMYHHTNDSDKLNITSSNTGTLQETLAIDRNMQRMIGNFYPTSSLKSDYLVLTLISR